MRRQDVDQCLSDTWERPEIVRDLKKVVTEIDESVPGARTKEMMFELVGLVLEMGERVRDLETRVTEYSPVQENRRRDDFLVVSTRRSEAKPRRDPKSGERIPTTAGTE